MNNTPSKGLKKALRRSVRRRWFRAAVLMGAFWVSILSCEVLFQLNPSLLPEPVSRHLEVSSGRQPESIFLRAYEHDDVLEHRAVIGFSDVHKTSEFRFQFDTVALPGLEPWGWRSRPFNSDRGLDTFIIGDSFATGYGVELDETLAGRIIQFEDQRGKQAFNLGLSNGTGTLQYEIILRKVFEYYSPSRVILLHFENDYLDNTFFTIWQNARETDQSVATEFPLSRRLQSQLCRGDVVAGTTRYGDDGSYSSAALRDVLYSRCALWNFGKYILRYYPYDLIETGRISSQRNAHYTLSPQLRIHSTEYGRECVQQGFDQAVASLTRIKELLDKNECDLCVVMIPFKESLLDHNPADAERYHIYRSRLAVHCRKMQTTVIDPLEQWKELISDQQIYFPADGHWTSVGHELAFDLVREEFLSD